MRLLYKIADFFGLIWEIVKEFFSLVISIFTSVKGALSEREIREHYYQLYEKFHETPLED